MFARKWVFVVLALSILVVLAGGCSPGTPSLGSADNPIVMTFVPSGDQAKIEGPGNQLIDMLKQKTGLNFKLTVGTSFAASIEAMGANKAQVGWLNTFSYVLANKKYGVQLGLVVVRNKNDYYNGQIIASKASGIKTIADLKGKTFCFVDPASTSGYIIPRIVMKANGVDPDKDLKQATNAGSHPKVATAVYKGDCDAGATFVDARTGIQQDYADVMDKVTVVDISMNIPNDTVSFAKDIPADTRTKIVDALLAIAATDDGAKVLAAHAYNIGGFTKHDDSFYNDFRSLLTKSGVDVETLIPK